jgi:hypothetical protein
MKSSITSLISKIRASQEETTKAVAYSEGYLDCIKDMLSEELNDLNKIMSVKYDGKVRGEVYSEILPMLEGIEKEESASEQPIVVIESEPVMHPSDRARSFLERIGR